MTGYSKNGLNGPAVEKLVEVWAEPGPHPEYHERIKAEVRALFPLLYDAVEDVARHAKNGWMA